MTARERNYSFGGGGGGMASCLHTYYAYVARTEYILVLTRMRGPHEIGECGAAGSITQSSSALGWKITDCKKKIRNYYRNYAVLENVLQYEKSGKFYMERVKWWDTVITLLRGEKEFLARLARNRIVFPISREGSFVSMREREDDLLRLSTHVIILQSLLLCPWILHLMPTLSILSIICVT